MLDKLRARYNGSSDVAEQLQATGARSSARQQALWKTEAASAKKKEKAGEEQEKINQKKKKPASQPMATE